MGRTLVGPTLERLLFISWGQFDVFLKRRAKPRSESNCTDGHVRSEPIVQPVQCFKINENTTLFVHSFLSRKYNHY